MIKHCKLLQGFGIGANNLIRNNNLNSEITTKLRNNNLNLKFKFRINNLNGEIVTQTRKWELNPLDSEIITKN